MHQLPARIQAVIGQEVQRPLAGGGEAVVHLLHLLGDVDVDGDVGIADQGLDLTHVLGVGRPQRVQRHARPHQRQARRVDALASVPHPGRIGAETPLRLAQLGLGEARVGVEHRQQREADSHLLRRLGEREGHRQLVLVGRAVLAVVQVVELADLRVAAGQQLGVELCRDGLQLARRDAQRDAVHAIAPGPEVVRLAVALLGQTDEGALERMAVRVDQTGQHRAVEAPRLRGRLGRGHARPDLDPMPVGIGAQQHVRLPASVQPRQRRMEDRPAHAPVPSAFRPGLASR